MKSISSLVAATLLAGTCCSVTASAQETKPAAPSKEQVLTAIQLLETRPRSDQAKGLRAELIAWLTDAPDVSVNVCAAIVNPFLQSKYRYHDELMMQVMLGGAAYILQHPDSAGNQVAINRAGILSSLRTYGVLRDADPAQAMPELDPILKARNGGTLDAWVHDALAECSVAKPQH
ncbi:MAG TPA: hypothetical protein VHI13_15645 [Candidatus Kapabacteria bacterium]|nr:hypothetical protein [Candidatus Kapabacteria bacterium]